MDNQSKIILIAGPTASGKSNFAVRLAKKIDGEIINADSMQIYKQLKIPERFVLHQNFPNPFNSKTLISFEIPSESFTSLDIYDIIGNRIINLQEGIIDAGSHRIHWDGINMKEKEVPSGIYFYKLSFDKRRISRKMILLN